MEGFVTAKEVARAREGLATMQAGRAYPKVRCVVRGAEVKRGQRGDYLAVTLGDRTGDLDAKCWDGAGLAPQLATGTVILLERLTIDEFRGERGGKFEPADLKVLPAGSYEPGEFIPTLPQELIEQNWSRLHEMLDTIENPHLERLREAVFSEGEVKERYKAHPSAVHHHHNYLGGNVEHILGIMRVIDAVCTSYPEIDRDVVLFGAAVHDLGKLREYAVDTTITVTDAGRLRGHLVIGAEWLGQICDRLRKDGYDFPRGIEDHLVHMILSHHRKGEWGSPKPPATAEAMLLHLADYADSQTRGFLQDLEKGKDSPDGWAKKWDADAGANMWIRTRRDWE